MPITKQEVRKELTEKFADIDSNQYFEDFVTVGYLLGNGPTYLGAHFDQLDVDMYTQLTGRFRFFSPPSKDQAKNYFQGRADGTRTSKDSDYSHLLTQALTLSEQGRGFQFDTGSNPKARLFIGNIRALTFLQNVQEKRHWKDPGAGVTHGEFTHRIQWYALSRASAEFTHGVSDIFSAIGGVYSGELEASKGGYQSGNFYALWDALVDRSAVGGEFSAVDDVDFRSPEKLHTWLKADTVRFPLLGTFLRFRSNKRQGQGEYEKFDLEAYAAKKFFRKPLKNLNTNERTTINQFMDQAIQGNSVLVKK